MPNIITYQLNNEKILASQLGDEGVIFDIEQNEYKVLNETLYKILEGIQAELTAVEIANNLVKEYQIDYNECLDQVQNSISTLLEKRYIIATA